MAHHCTYTEHLEVRDNDIVRMITAYYKDKHDTIYYERLKDGECFGRYFEVSNLAGYLVSFVGETRRYYYGCKEIVEEQDFEPYYPCEIVGENEDTIDERFSLIEKMYPDLKYLLFKLKNHKIYKNITNAFLFVIIRKYWKHPELENLIQYNQLKLATDERLYKLTKNKLKQVLNFVKEHSSLELTLNDILCCLKYKIPIDRVNDYRKCKQCGCDSNVFKYLLKQKKDINFVYYVDYIGMVERAGHNADDPYWKYPKNIVAQHDKLMKELALINEKQNKLLKAKFNLVASNVSKNKNYVVEDYSFYVPTEYDDVCTQAKELHQCLITCDYVSKMINQKCVLIFIKQQNKPFGTIEIDYTKNIVQAYGNELDRANCQLPNKIIDYAKQFIHTLKLRKKEYDFSILESAN